MMLMMVYDVVSCEQTNDDNCIIVCLKAKAKTTTAIAIAIAIATVVATTTSTTIVYCFSTF